MTYALLHILQFPQFHCSSLDPRIVGVEGSGFEKWVLAPIIVRRWCKNTVFLICLLCCYWLMLRNAKANNKMFTYYFSTAHLCLGSCMCCTERLTFCCCTVITSLPGANGSLVCWFCLVLFQWFFLSGRMSALCAWPSLRTLDVILSTWSLHYLLSSTMLPSRCSATWNAWLASSLKPSWNCVLKRCRLFLLSPPSSGVCRSQKKIPPLARLQLSQRENTQKSLRGFYLISCCLECTIFYTLLQNPSKFNAHRCLKNSSVCRFHDLLKSYKSDFNII